MKNDKELIKQIKSGSAVALEELVNKYYDEIFAYGYRTLGSYDDASDVTQDVFMAMMKAMPNYQERGKFKSWLFTIAHNLCMNCLSMRRYHQDIDDLKDLSTKEDFTHSYIKKEYVKAILDTLPLNQRVALILKYYHDLTAKEIGKITKANISTVKSRLYQGMQKLKVLVRDGENNEKK